MLEVVKVREIGETYCIDEGYVLFSDYKILLFSREQIEEGEYGLIEGITSNKFKEHFEVTKRTVDFDDIQYRDILNRINTIIPWP